MTQLELEIFLAAYSFDELNSSLVLDESENGYHGELSSGITKSSGKFNNAALLFDGENDALILPKIEYLDNPSSFSYSFWFKRLSDNNQTSSATEFPNILFSQSSSDFT